jgi:hypothetical protein
VTRVTWRNRKNTKTPTKAFDVSDVRRVTAELVAQQIVRQRAATEPSVPGPFDTVR